MNTQTFRKTKIIMMSARLWRKRLVFWCGAIIVGIISSYFAIVTDKVTALFNAIFAQYMLAPLLMTPLVFAVSSWVTLHYFPTARGSGIPQAIAARVMRDPENRERLLGIRIAAAKILLTLVGLLGGACIGREGPTVQIGASVMLLCAGLGGLSAQRGIVLAGAAAGVAAAFNTPLAGIIFAIEEMARAFEHRNSSIVLSAIILSGAAAMAILGDYNYFGYTDIVLTLTQNWKAVLVVGVVGGITGGLFTRFIIDGEPMIRNAFGQFGRRRPVMFAAMCGLFMAFLGIATHGMAFGSGYAMGHSLLHGEMEPRWWMAPVKLMATILSTLSGIPGGIFSPSLSIGAAMGADMAQWFTDTSPQGMIILAMVAYFAGVTHAPITAFVIVLEITGKATAAVPLIATGVIAAGISRVISPTSFYHALAKNFMVSPQRDGGRAGH